MSKYLDRLKSEKRPPHPLQKVQKAPSYSFYSTYGELISEKRVVEPLDVQRLIEERLAEIDRQGRPWTGFHGALTANDRQLLRDVEVSIDLAALENDQAGVMLALDAYQYLLAALRRRLN